jgi:hypothetical protein
MLSEEKIKIYNSLSIEELQAMNYQKFDFNFNDAQEMEDIFVKEYEGKKEFDLYYNSLRQIISHAYQRAVDDMHKFFTGKEVELPF